MSDITESVPATDSAFGNNPEMKSPALPNTSISEEKKDGKQPKKQKRFLGGILLAFVLLLAGAIWFLFARPIPFEKPGEPVSIIVSEGDSARKVLARITESGLRVSPITLRIAARVTNHPLNRIHAGLYRFEPGITAAGVLKNLTGGAMADRTLRIPEGAPVWEVISLIRANEGIKQTTDAMSLPELSKALGLDSATPEGWFAPDTYHFVSGTSDISLMKKAVDEQKKRLSKAWETRSDKSQAKTMYEALILASIIEKETGHPADRTLVSSVFNNRLRIRMPLQTDPTVIYGIGETFDGNITRKHLQTPTPYNTYKIQGLPPTPIAMPSLASIEAALHPAETRYLYFVSRGDGTSEFSATLTEHNRAVKKFIFKK